MRRSIASASLLASLSLATLLTPRPAHAQSHAGDVAAAQALFDDARALMKAGKYVDACPKLEESERLDGGPGTEFNLADCYEHAGRTASAWAEFSSVADSLHALGQRDREKFARDRATALQPKLTKLVVNVSALSRTTGLEVKRDGEVLRDAQWGSGVPVDPGKHVISATAPGKQPWQQTVDTSGDGKTTTVEVPLLGSTQPAPPPPAVAPTPVVIPGPAPSPAPAPESAAIAPTPEPSSHPMSGQKVAALVAGGLGVVGVAVGGYFGSQAISKHNQYAPLCPNNVCTDQNGVQLHNDASSDATISSVTVAIGAVAIVGGVVLWLTAPSTARSAPVTGVRIVPRMDARGGGLSLQGSW